MDQPHGRQRAWNNAVTRVAHSLGVNIRKNLRSIEDKSIARLGKRSPFSFVLVSGPSGSGKGTIEAELMARFTAMKRLPNATTRPPRQGEVDGVDYHFISEVEFNGLDTAGEFIQTNTTHGARHGLRRSEFQAYVGSGKTFLMDKSIDSTRKLLAERELNRLNYLTIFLLPPSHKELERRLKNRNAQDQSLDGEWVTKRLSRASEELAESVGLYDVYIVNDEVDRAAQRIADLL